MLCNDLEGWGEGWEGGPRERGRVYIYIADSCLCTAETNTTLESNYFAIKIFFKKKILGLRELRTTAMSGQ